MRAVEGGVGAAKTGGNYAASLLASDEAKHLGYTQVLWLDGVHRKYLDEVGTMNIMVKIGDEVVTPPLGSNTILPGVTRDSVLTLLRDWGVRASERQVSIDEVAEAHRRAPWPRRGGRTAAVISPVGELAYKGEKMVINGGAPARSRSGCTTPSWAFSTDRGPTPTGDARGLAVAADCVFCGFATGRSRPSRSARTSAPWPSWISTRSAQATAW